MDDIDFDAVAQALIGGLITYALVDFVFTGADAQLPQLNRAAAVVEVIMHSLVHNTPSHSNDTE